MKTYNYILVSAMLLSVVACSNDDNMFSQYEADPYVVRIQPSISGIEETRTSPADDNKSTAFNNGDEICMHSEDEGFNNSFFKYTYNGENWIPGFSFNYRYFRWDDSKTTKDGKLVITDCYAYYPVSSSGNQDSFTIPTDQSTAEKIAQADFMTYYGDITTDKDSNGIPSPVTFTMKRRTSRICVNIKSFVNQYDGKNPKCDVTIYSQSKEIELSYTKSDVTVAGNGYNPVEITPYNGKDLEKNGVAIALVSPQHKTQSNTEPTDMSDKVFVKVVVKYDTDKTDILYVKGIPEELKAGYSYTYNLKVGKDVVTVGSVEVSSWNTDVIEGGTATCPSE